MGNLVQSVFFDNKKKWLKQSIHLLLLFNILMDWV